MGSRQSASSSPPRRSRLSRSRMTRTQLAMGRIKAESATCATRQRTRLSPPHHPSHSRGQAATQAPQRTHHKQGRQCAQCSTPGQRRPHPW
eukprot:3123447-Prymnesium_polylepis.1